MPRLSFVGVVAVLMVGLVSAAPAAEATTAVNRGAMASWARDWSQCHRSDYLNPLLGAYCIGVGRNPAIDYGAAYWSERAADCTDFVSDALHLGGGMPMDEDGDQQWYTKRHLLVYRERSHSWTVEEDWRHYWRVTMGAQTYATHWSPTTNITDADLGDVIRYNWGNGEGYDHLAVETAYGDATWKDVNGNKHSFHGDLVSQHSHWRRNSPWNLGYLKEQDPTRRRAMRQAGWYIIHWANSYNGYAG